MQDRTPSDAGYYLDEYDAPRFWSHVNFRGGKPYLDDPLSHLGDDAGECWVWQGWVSGNEAYPYGRFNVHGNSEQAHHLGIEEFNVRIPEGFVVDHLCRNTICVRHNHLEPVTQLENIRRGSTAQATHCRNGHEFTPDNTRMVSRNGGSFRLCITCRRIYKARAYRESLSA